MAAPSAPALGAAGTAQPPIASTPSAVAAPVVRELMCGSPSYSETLKRQRANLDTFLANNLAEFDAMPYEPWTAHSPHLTDKSVSVRSSSVAAGILGVYLNEPIQTHQRKKAILVYPGLLVTRELLEALDDFCYCPTALDLPSLDYSDEHGTMIHISVVGDPTAAGAILNDGDPANRQNNCELLSVKAADVSRVKRQLSNGKIRVSTGVAQIFVRAWQNLSPNDELLVSYGGEMFWRRVGAGAEYCATCFLRTVDAQNPLVQCEGVHAGTNAPCKVSRHRCCFPHPPSMEDIAAESAVHFFCPDHLAQARADPRACTRQRAVHSHGVTFTPPPAVSPQPVMFTPPDPAAAAAANAAAASGRGQPRAIQFDHSCPTGTGVPQSPSALSHARPSVLIKAMSLQPEEEQCFSDGFEFRDDDSVSAHSSPSSASSSSSFGFSDVDRDVVALSKHGHRGNRDRKMGDAPGVRSHSEEMPPELSKLKIRTPQQAAKLPDYGAQMAALTSAQEQLILDLQKAHGERRPRPWYIPVPRSSKPESAAVLDSSQGSVCDVDLAGGVAPMDLDDGASHASGKITSNRFRHAAPVAADWAEYRSCCGASHAVAPLLVKLSPAAAQSHSSRSVIHFFEARLTYRAASMDKASHDLKLREALRNIGKDQTVHWQGGEVCVSCFRALIGVCKGTLYSRRNQLDPHDRVSMNVTASGRSRRPRSNKQTQRMIQLLLEYVASYGQSPPNPKSKKQADQLFVLPHRRRCDVLAALATFQEQQPGNHDQVSKLTAGTFSRAVKELKTKRGITIAFTKSKDLCRCDDCDMLDNILQDRKALSQKAFLFHTQRKEAHLRTMKLQRDQVDRQKALALKQPSEVWCVMLDGMDQAKTRLPSRVRFSKKLDGLQRLKLHVVGAMCFGGAVPVMGLINFPDLRKDSSLSVTTLERILDIQWRQMEEQAKEEAPGGVGAPSLEEQPYRGIGDRWPKRLHVTFDNAAGECKNQWMFRFLGLLVLHSVFKFVTVSTLLVGHTHDIIDQMFGVWAKILKINNAATYERMRDLFREKYHSRIQGIVAIMRGQVEASGVLLDEEAAEVLEASRCGPDAAEWNGEAADKLAAFAADVCRDTSIQPHITAQIMSINVQAWMTAAHGGPFARERQLSDIDRPHEFAIEKDLAGDVYLYNKFLADSETRSDRGEQHHYTKQECGAYSARALLWKEQERVSIDPSCLPPQPVETTSLRTSIKVFREANAVTEAEKEQFIARLDRFDGDQQGIAEHCEPCATLINGVAAIGTISRRKNATSQELTDANKKSTQRKKRYDELMEHVKDPQFAANHRWMVQDRWWTKWLERVKDHIVPSYVERGIMADPQHAAASYHLHPAALVSNGVEPALIDAANRVDLSWLGEHGPPKLDDLIVVRASDVRMPFWIGKITGFVKAPASAACAPAAAAAAASQVEHGAAEAAPASSASMEFARVHHRERPRPGKVTLKLEDLPSMMVHWYDLTETECTRLRLNDDEHWLQLFAQHGTTEAEQAAVPTDEHGQPEFVARLPWHMDLFEACKFAPMPKEKGSKVGWLGRVEPAQLVVWEPTLLTASGQVRDPFWRRLRLDLTEQTCTSSASTLRLAARRTNNAAGGRTARSRGKRKSRGSDSEEESSSEAEAAAPAATAQCQRPTRSAKTMASLRTKELAASQAQTSELEESDELDSNHHSDEDNTPLSLLVQQQHASHRSPRALSPSLRASKRRR